MIYVFTFLGEFGYELLNWQGVIRKFAKKIGPEDKVVCCSRASLYPIYETADQYIDISDISAFKASQASGYTAITPNIKDYSDPRNVALNEKIKTAVIKFVSQKLPKVDKKIGWFGRNQIEYVFSSEPKTIKGLKFGNGDIYDRMDVNNNEFVKIIPDLTKLSVVKKKLGFDPSKKPYILVQSRNRQVVIRSEVVIPKEDLIKKIAKKTKVVLLSFNTGRKFDSYSKFANSLGGQAYSCGSFVEQAILVAYAKKCLFFTEGDYGSHIYVPPLLGKNVYAVAPKDMYNIRTTPIEFWNSKVFRFGGKIYPVVSEDLFSSVNKLEKFINENF